MSTLTLTDAKIWVNTYDLSGDMNAVALEEGVEARDATTFGAGTRTRKGGIRGVRLTAAGFFNAAGSGRSDDVLPTLVGNVPPNLNVVSIGPAGATEGNPAFILPASLLRYTFGDEVDAMLPFSLEASAVRSQTANPTRPVLGRGTILLASQKTTTGSGTAFNLGAVAAGQKLYVAVHVLAQSGGTPTLRVQSDSANNFPSPADQVTLVGPSADFRAVAGPITDPWWRADWTFTGTTFTAIVIAAIR